MLCRDEVGLIEQRTAFVNQLQEALHEYYPTALAAFGDWTVPGPWAFVEQLRVLEQQLKVYRKRIEKLFQEHPDHDLFGSLPGVGDKLGPRAL